MARKKPERRIVTERTNNNVKRRLAADIKKEEKDNLLNTVKYGAYSKHKLNPSEYGLSAYNGPDEERTYCDAHASFFKKDLRRIPKLIKRGIELGLWSDQSAQGVPRMLWTIDHTGWIYELRITNTGLSEYHGYPVLQNDAFAKIVLKKACQTIEERIYPISQDPKIASVIATAENFYK